MSRGMNNFPERLKKGYSRKKNPMQKHRGMQQHHIFSESHRSLILVFSCEAERQGLCKKLEEER